jgi:vitamin B12 transporter
MIKSHLRAGAGCAVLLSSFFWLAPAFAQQTPPAPAAPDTAQVPPAASTGIMPEVVVTATGRPEDVTKIAGTIQVIDGDRISKSVAKSVTDLLAENAVGFMSEWTAGQTSLNIRGAATEGQGRDFKSEVLVLINGHRAGTANISKLSVADVERIEIVRGPSSVVYGSQNMGGVVNIILKTGRSAPGTLLEASTGSWNLTQGKAQTGGVDKSSGIDWYLGLAGGNRLNYQVGGGAYESNTAFTREGGTGALGWQIDADNRVDMTVRTDGVYDTGFRGSSSNIFAFDTRYNQSIDFSYNGKTPDDRGHLFIQGYYVQDVDALNNPSPFSNLNGVTSRTTLDYNRRQIDVEGIRAQPRYKLIPSNELLVGVDWERSWIISNRSRAGGSAVTQLSPQDNNETDQVWAFYAEDSQTFFDRWTIRGGVRQTYGTTTLLATPNAPTLVQGSTNYNATTYSVGSTLQVTDWLTGRVGASSGFRAPTATELGSNFTTTPIGTTIFGNSALSPETSQQVEIGGTITTRDARLDLALFQNIIGNRIQANTISSAGGVIVQQYQNNPGNIVVQGLELQGEADVHRMLGLPVDPGTRWSVFTNGYYNFQMTDYGANTGITGTNQATRMYQYEASIGTRYGKLDAQMPWNVSLLGQLRGPMYYNTEESLNPILFPGQVRNTTVYYKDAFWVWSTRGEIEVRKGMKFFAAINNIFDINNSPIFIGLQQQPCGDNQAAQNGSCGNSMPGREFIIGAQIKF